MKIAVAKGDGIGPEIMDTVIEVFNAAKVPLEYDFIDMGKWVFDKGFSNGMTAQAKDTIEDLFVIRLLFETDKLLIKLVERFKALYQKIR